MRPLENEQVAIPGEGSGGNAQVLPQFCRVNPAHKLLQRTDQISMIVHLIGTDHAGNTAPRNLQLDRSIIEE